MNDPKGRKRGGASPRPGAPEVEHDRGRSLLHALRNTGITVLYQDLDLRVLWAENMPATWSAEEIIGKTDSDFLPAAQAELALSAKDRVLASLHPERIEISIPHSGGALWFDVWIDADQGPDGTVQGIVTTAVDRTESKRREQTLKTLLRELSHRSKNLLAIIQSIATQTGRYSGTIDNFLSRFHGRLQSLASSQDLVTSSNWRGADLHELVVGQVARYSAQTGNSVLFEGVNPYLNPNAALHIGLAMHELAVNSLSYGALARPGGVVTVAAQLENHSADRPTLSLVWTELVGTPIDGFGERRFGSVALERVVPRSLNGSSSLSIEGNRLQYRLLVPSGNFEID
ncbi:histidine kinase [Pseudaminobacter arsenicus]|uniref:Blue-light-activated histidine kinase n=1 Tax=Borborobacter arsenicus TaxID=1851146 RepID=A0A432V6A8_9HYPH|nr:PAS domain-containing sensor histidine kinase [Pseudaminobacter arsenicus]RUM97669.1 histidine kinase [Pseudaminobacter arsenicus]